MNNHILNIAKQSGFKIFGNKIVAADNGSSGDATQCLEKFSKALIEEILAMVEPMPGSGDLDDVVLSRIYSEIKEKYKI